jgi:DNA processing protein
MFTDNSPILPFKETVAYEALWADSKTSFKTLATLFAKFPGSRPSDFVEENKISQREEIRNCILKSKKDFNTNILINGSFDFPRQLKDAKEPVELLYYTGYLEYLRTRCIAIVGTRHPSKKGLTATTEITETPSQKRFYYCFWISSRHRLPSTYGCNGFK